MLVDTLDELMEWVFHGEKSGVQGRTVLPKTSEATEAVDLYFSEGALQADAGGDPENEDWRRSLRPDGPEDGPFNADQWLSGNPSIPHNRLTRWLFPPNG